MSGEPTTDRALLTKEAYASGEHLSAPQALYHYQSPTYDLPGIVIANLPTGRGIVADVGCGNGLYLRAWAHQAGVPIEPTLQRVRERLTAAIECDGAFTISTRGGTLIARR